MKGAAALRARLAQPGIIVAPGAPDALTARIIQDSGFDVVYATGSGIANASLGVADVGLTTMTEMVSTVWRIVEAVQVPVIADADTGHGGVLNVMRTVREFERAGAAGIHIEDQGQPKRCGHFEGKTVVSTAEMVQHLRAALHARQDPDFLIIARTDARASEGFASAVERSRAYAAAGVDMIFVEALESVAELERLPKEVPAPLVANMVEGGKTPLVCAAELEAMGYRIVFFANAALRVAAKAIQEAMLRLREEGTTASLVDQMLSWQERQRLVRLPELEMLEQRFTEHGEQQARRGQH